MTDTQALLSELARVKALFQLRTLSLVLHGGESIINPSTLQHRVQRSDGRGVSDAGGRVLFHSVGTSPIPGAE